MAFDLSAGELAVRIDIDPGDRVRIDAVELGQRRPERALRVAGRHADLLAGKVLDAGDAGALEPIHAERGIGVDVHDGDDLASLPSAPMSARAMSARPIGEPPVETCCIDADRAFARLQVDVDAGLVVPAHLLGVVHRRVIAAGDPVQGDLDLLRGGRGQASPARRSRRRRRTRRQRRRAWVQSMQGMSFPRAFELAIPSPQATRQNARRMPVRPDSANLIGAKECGCK